MRSAIIKVSRQPQRSVLWLSVIKALQDKKFKVFKDFSKPADVNIVLSGLFENPNGYTGKKVLVLNRNEWHPAKFNAWGSMYRDIVKHYYDEIVDVTDKTPKEIVNTVIEYIDAQERQTHKS